MKKPENNNLTENGQNIARSLIKDLSPLVSPPEVCLKVGELLQQGTSSSNQIANVIIHDPNLTARLLKLVNSSYFGLNSKIDTVSRAVTVIGNSELTSLVYAITSVSSFSRIPDKISNMNTFWQHSVYTGLVASQLAKRTNVLQPERLFVAGLLHDIGTLVINTRFPELAKDIIEDAGGEEEHLYKMEQKLLGFDHAFLGALMLEDWNLSENLCRAVRWHHEPMRAKEVTLDACILHISEILANRSSVGSYCEMISLSDEIDPEAIKLLGLQEDFQKSINYEEVELKFEETMNVLVA